MSVTVINRFPQTEKGLEVFIDNFQDKLVSSAGGNGTISGTIQSVGSKSTKVAGDPVFGAEVFIEQNPNNVPLQASITDSQGKYRFTGLVQVPNIS